MTDQELDIEFIKAVDYAMTLSQASLPQDVQLRLYAYYKQASFGTSIPKMSTDFDLRNAFKTNAWMQICHISVREAKELYIETINSIIAEK